ncbi:MAG: DUF3383 domain-containing protein [Methanobrevibacter sp.]|nr:DUF3383 domain-containing protein [Methanobrevibacter sp.]
MTIPASQLVDITPRVIGGGLSGLAFVGTLLSKSTRLPANQAVPFYSQKAVGDYFGTTSDEYALAGNYFIADSNSSKKPDVLWFFRKLDAASKAFLRGSSNPATLDELKAITAGTLTITVDGTAKTLTGLDFSAQTSFSGVASVVQTALSGATCEWDTNFNAFVITSPTTPTSEATSSLTFATGTAAEAMGLTSGTLSQGALAASLTETMTACVNANSNFWSFMPVWQEAFNDALELASWCNNQGVRFMYAMVDNSEDGKTVNNQACLAYQTKDYYGVCALYNTKALGAMAMGIGAAINPAQLNGRKTWAYKQQTGLAFTVNDETSAPILLANGYNFYGDYATASNQFKLFQNGQISGNAKWIDTYYGQIYIRDGLQNAWINALMMNNTVPYNQSGYGILRAAAMDIINSAVNAGFIRQGVALSESQKATVQSEAGLDISGALETQGWYLQILDPTTQVRQERGTPVVNFWYMDGGSVQLIQGTSTVLL